MEWLLILTFTLSGQTETQPVGVMRDEQVCLIAGAGMAAILEQANPGLTVAVLCLPEVTA